MSVTLSVSDEVSGLQFTCDTAGTFSLTLGSGYYSDQDTVGGHKVVLVWTLTDQVFSGEFGTMSDSVSNITSPIGSDFEGNLVDVDVTSEGGVSPSSSLVLSYRVL